MQSASHGTRFVCSPTVRPIELCHGAPYAREIESFSLNGLFLCKIQVDPGHSGASGRGGNSIDIYPTELITWGVGFSEGLAKITISGRSGFINKSGHLAIPPRFTMAKCFSERLAAVEIKGGCGLTDL